MRDRSWIRGPWGTTLAVLVVALGAGPWPSVIAPGVAIPSVHLPAREPEEPPGSGEENYRGGGWTEVVCNRNPNGQRKHCMEVRVHVGCYKREKTCYEVNAIAGWSEDGSSGYVEGSGEHLSSGGCDFYGGDDWCGVYVQKKVSGRCGETWVGGRLDGGAPRSASTRQGWCGAGDIPI